MSGLIYCGGIDATNNIPSYLSEAQEN